MKNFRDKFLSCVGSGIFYAKLAASSTAAALSEINWKAVGIVLGACSLGVSSATHYHLIHLKTTENKEVNKELNTKIEDLENSLNSAIYSASLFDKQEIKGEINSLKKSIETKLSNLTGGLNTALNTINSNNVSMYNELNNYIEGVWTELDGRIYEISDLIEEYTELNENTFQLFLCALVDSCEITTDEL